MYACVFSLLAFPDKPFTEVTFHKRISLMKRNVHCTDSRITISNRGHGPKVKARFRTVTEVPLGVSVSDSVIFYGGKKAQHNFLGGK